MKPKQHFKITLSTGSGFMEFHFDDEIGMKEWLGCNVTLHANGKKFAEGQLSSKTRKKVIRIQTPNERYPERG